MKQFNINAPVREYQDNQGQKKTQWHTSGRLVCPDENIAAAISQNPKGLFIVWESTPISLTWDGRCGIFEPRQAQPQAPAQPQYQQPQYQQPQYQQPQQQPQYQQPQQQPQYQQPAPQAQYPQQQPKQYRDDLPF